MPRRPRPLYRAPPKSKRTLLNQFAAQNSRQSTSKNAATKQPQEQAQDSDSAESEEDNISNGSKESSENDVDVDVDQPRAAQWVDEDELPPVSGKGKLRDLQQDLSSLPFGALLKARRTLRPRSSPSNSSSDQSDSEHKMESPFPKGTSEGSKKPKSKRDIEKRSSKHAPTEVTSKRPVPRRRQVVEVKTPQSRDPRFNPLAGEFSAEHFRANYNFLTPLHSSELSTLKQSLSRAKKLLVSSPRDLQAEREAEVQRLERAVKRAETLVGRDKREEVEHSAIQRVKHQERQQRAQGKKAWFLKDSAKKELVLKARFDSLSKSGVQKIIEKKQKKIAQREKRSRPFAKGQEFRHVNSRNDGMARKRTRPEGMVNHEQDSGWGNKRRKLG